MTAAGCCSRGGRGSSPALAPFSGQFIRRISFSSRGLGDHLGACVSTLQACAALREVSKGVAIHACAVVRGWLRESPSVVTSLINFYSKCGRPGDALAVFRRAAGAANVFQWNAAIAGMAANGLPREALGLYREMEAAGLAPDKFTFPCAIMACAELYKEGCCSLSLVELRSLHCRLTKMGLQSDVFVASALVNAYMKVDSTEYAARLFEALPERDVVLWNSMVNGLAQGGRLEDALRFFRRMAAEGVAPSKFTITGVVSAFSSMGDLRGGGGMHGLVEKSGHGADVAVSNSLIDLYGKCGAVEEAGRIFGAVPEKDLLSWNSMIAALVQSGDYGGALRLFDRMRMGPGEPSPDAVTASAILPACAHTAALMRGREVHGSLVVGGLRRRGDIFLDNAVMDMYAKCGSLGDARSLFERMPSRDVASWNIIIGGYAAHGRGPEALQLFSRMCCEAAAPPPDEVTFVGVLSACSHAGLVAEGRELLRRMGPEFGVPPAVEHYACAVDMLGRAGLLAEAHELAASAPTGPSPVVWRAYLAACRLHGATDRAAAAAGELLEMEPEHCGSYVLLSNAYGSAGRHGEVSAIRSAMRGRCVRKTPGCSWIELGAEVHAFVTGDRSHEASDGIYALLEALAGRLRECGNLPDAQPPGE